MARRYDFWRTEIIEAQALIEAEIDFSDEGDVVDSVYRGARARIEDLARKVSTHLSSASRGEIIRSGYRVVIAGPTNAGKSSLLNALALPAWLSVVLAVVLLDLAIYLQPVMFHAVPALWRLHRMHHADLDFDVTTGARFHPIEILLSMALKLGVVAALGAPALAVLVFEVLLNATAMFNHANARLPEGLDRVLRWIVVTPDMHRVHHSVVPRETNSNFGFNLPWWDRLLGTYHAQPAAGHTAMTIGLEQFRDPRDLWLDRLLAQPFRGEAGEIPIDRR